MSRPHLAALSAALLYLASFAACAAPDALLTKLETQHGAVEVRGGANVAAILYRGKQIASVAAEGASLLRMASGGERDFVIVSASRPGLHCRHFYLLLGLSDGPPRVSDEFGECSELGGAGFSGREPVIHLTNPADPGAGVASYQWTAKGMALAFESSSVCGASGFLARKNGKPITSEAQERQAAGAGRVQFLSAPDAACVMPGVFVVAGDRLTASLALDGFVLVNYTNPKTGRRVEGWVARERVSD
jgi:hypothetical protein